MRLSDALPPSVMQEALKQTWHNKFIGDDDAALSRAKIMAEVEKDIQFFQDAMRYKLEKNAHKGRWENISVERALELLEKEVQELKEAIAKGNNVEIIMESADVANFAMIAAVIATERATARGARNV